MHNSTMKKILLLLVLSVFSLSALAQVVFKDERLTEEENARFSLALTYSDSGREDESIAILDELIEKHPDLSFLKFEKAYCLSRRKQDYKSAYETLKPAMSAPDAVPEIFSAAAQCQEMMGKPKEALETYEAGIKRFPHSGSLYLKTGDILIAQGHTKEGIKAYERGIKADPGNPSNYYRAVQYLIDDQPVKAIIYAELHNIICNPVEPLGAEVSKMLYDAYNANIHFEADTVRTTFSRDRDIVTDINAVDRPDALLKDPSTVAQEIDFDKAMKASIDVKALKAAGGQLTLAELTAIRRRFMKNYASGEKGESAAKLFLLQSFVLHSGNWEAYNMYMMREGRPEEYSAWLQDNAEAIEAFYEYMWDDRENGNNKLI